MTDDEKFLAEAEAQLDDLVQEATEQDRRCGTRNARDRAIAALQSQRNAIRSEMELIERGIGQLKAKHQPARLTAEQEAAWLKAARRELAELIRSVEGPKPRRGRPSEGR